jgi:hypothetical protein
MKEWMMRATKPGNIGIVGYLDLLWKVSELGIVFAIVKDRRVT